MQAALPKKTPTGCFAPMGYTHMDVRYTSTTFWAKPMKAQLMLTDMSAAILIFLVIVSAITIAWNSSVDRALQDAQRKDMELSATRILDILVRTPGYPVDWETKDASVIGLASSDRTIDDGKLNAFMDMDYNKTKDIFGISYDFFFRMGNYTKGINRTDVYVRRMVIFNGTQVAELSLSR